MNISLFKRTDLPLLYWIFHCYLCFTSKTRTGKPAFASLAARDQEGENYTPPKECPSQKCKTNKQAGEVGINPMTDPGDERYISLDLDDFYGKCRYICMIIYSFKTTTNYTCSSCSIISRSPFTTIRIMKVARIWMSIIINNVNVNIIN